MQPQDLAYLSRYGFILLLVLALASLLRAALRDFQGRIRAGRKPVPGFFLLATGKDDQNLVSSLPLFHTTSMGSARSSDICLRDSSIAYRHAVIYIYNGAWFLAPSTGKVPLQINGVPITVPIPLEDQDRIDIGACRFIFVNERKAAAQAGLAYREETDGRRWERPQIHTLFPWFLLNLYMLGGGALMYVLQSGTGSVFRRTSLILLGLTFVSANLFYMILPTIFRYVDRAILLCCFQLIFLGNWIQIRFQTLGWLPDELTQDVLTGVQGRLDMMLYLELFCLFVIPGILLLTAKTEVLERVSLACMILTPLMLLATRVLGSGAETHGASLWIHLGPISIQLTEYVKIAYLIVLASFFKNRPPLKKQILFACWAGLVFVLIMLLPDLGTIMVLLPTTIVVFFVMTSEYLITAGILLVGSGLSILVYTLFPYVQRRISGWASLWAEVNETNSQIVYGLQSISRGAALGRGLGNGSPLGTPQYMDDMVFSALCEDLGLITGIAVVLLFIIIWLRGARMSMEVRDGFSSSLMLGLCTAFFMEAAVVISGTTGLIPLTGATLPFIARGGSSFLAKALVMALVLGLGARREKGRSFHEKLSA